MKKFFSVRQIGSDGSQNLKLILLFLLISLFGFILSITLGRVPFKAHIVFYYLFFHYEIWMSLLGAIIGCAAVLYLHCHKAYLPLKIPCFSWPQVICIGILTLLFCWWGSHYIYLKYPLSMDEYAPLFQAKIFAAGHIRGQIPPELIPYAKALTPVFTIYDSTTHSVMEFYLPVHALLLSGALLLGDPALLNPILLGAAVPLIFQIARQWKPDSVYLPFWAVVLLVANNQILITSMSNYSMTAHMFLNLLWLFCYIQPNPRWFVAVPLIGALAIGLHQPHCHVLFVAPFLFRLLLEKKWQKVLYAGFVYSAALIFWLYWIGLTRSNESNQQTVACFGFPGILQFIIQLINLCIFTNWMPFVTLPLLFIALRNFKAADPVTRDLFYGLGLTIVFYFFFLLDQGHGWGYRYLNPVLGNVLLLSSLGLVKSSEKTALWSRMTLCAILIAFFIQLPIRCFEVRQFVQKFALPYQKISKLDADFVIIDSSNIWYGNELVRNDPYFQNRPVLLLNQYLSEENLKQLHSRSSKIKTLHYDDLIRLGLPPGRNVTAHFNIPKKT